MEIRRFYFIVLISSFFFPVICHGATYQSDHTPWSGYWWPFTRGELALGYNNKSISPMRKYDQALTGNKNGAAYSNGLDLYYDKESVSWGGLCFAWAMASISEEEPKKRGVYNEVIFNVGDIKGLLTAIYDNVKFITYDFRYPIYFHDILNQYIKEYKVPVVMNLGSEDEEKDEVWNYPVYKYDTSHRSVGTKVEYTTTIYFADDNVDPDYVGTKELHRTYTYFLELDGDIIIDSGWTGSSISNHPENARILYGGADSSNRSLRIDTVKEIAATEDDQFKGNNSIVNAVSLFNGDFTLLALSDDYFEVNLKNGDTLNLGMVPEYDYDNSTDYPISLTIQTAEGVLEKELNGDGFLTFTPLFTGRYLIKISTNDYSKQPGYKLSSRLSLNCFSLLPGLEGGQWENELAIVSEDSVPGDRIIVSVIEKNGTIKSSNRIEMNAVSLKALISESPYFFDEFDTEAVIRIDSDSPVDAFLSSCNSSGTLMMGSSQIYADDLSETLFYTHLAGNTTMWEANNYLINTGTSQETVRFEAYGSDGAILHTKEITVDPESVTAVNPAHLGFSSLGVSAMSASSLSLTKILAGYTKYAFTLNGFLDESLSLIKAPGLNNLSDYLVFPHIASNDYWYTGIVIMNAGDLDDSVVVTAYGADGEILGSGVMPIKSKQSLVNAVSALIPGVLSSEITSLGLESLQGRPLTAFAHYMTKDYKQLAAVLAGPPVNSTSLVLPFTGNSRALHTGIGIMNTANISDWVTLSLLDGNGLNLAETAVFLMPNQRIATTLWGFAGIDLVTANQGYVKIESSSGASLSGLFMTGSNEQLAGGHLR